jgi:signal transduction histidine kinase
MEIRKNIFLIFKEAVTNVMKHANASAIHIAIAIDEKTLSLTVKDNGKGFDTEASDNGVGLGSMQSRARAAGGAFTVYSSYQDGTFIQFSMPVYRFRQSRPKRKA